MGRAGQGSTAILQGKELRHSEATSCLCGYGWFREQPLLLPLWAGMPKEPVPTAQGSGSHLWARASIVGSSSTWCDPFSSRWAWVSCPSPSPQQAVGIQQSRFTLGSAVDPSPVSIYNPGTRGQSASRAAPNREGPSTASLSLPVTRWLHGLGSPCRKDAIRC